MRDANNNLPDPQERLFSAICNGTLTAEERRSLETLLTTDARARESYVRYMDLQASIRLHALDAQYRLSVLELRGIDAVLTAEMQNNVSASVVEDPAGPQSSALEEVPHGSAVELRWAFGWETRVAAYLAMAVIIVTVAIAIRSPLAQLLVPQGVLAIRSGEAVQSEALYGAAKLQGAVGARWGGEMLLIPEGTMFPAGQRLDLVEGLAELTFGEDVHVVVQGPAILHIQDEHRAEVSVGRFAVRTAGDGAPFTFRTCNASLSANDAQFGVDVDVDGSLVTRVFHGDLEVVADDKQSTARLQLIEGGGIRYAPATGVIQPISEPERYTFVRFLPVHETLVNLVDIVAGGNGQGVAHHQGVRLTDGRLTHDYAAPAVADGSYHSVSALPFVDGVFIPTGREGGDQIDSLGRRFTGFGITSSDCWGGVIAARRPDEERLLPSIRLEFHGDNYGYVNWLHTASNPKELSPAGLGMIGMHSNSGITFDLHAIRAKYPNRQVLQFRAIVGNLESKSGAYNVDAWVLVDGKPRYHRSAFSREDGPEEVALQLTDQDRFLVLAVTDSDGSTAYDWAAFGDAVIELAAPHADKRASASAWPSRRRLNGGMPRGGGAVVGDDVSTAVRSSASAMDLPTHRS